MNDKSLLLLGIIGRYCGKGVLYMHTFTLYYGGISKLLIRIKKMLIEINVGATFNIDSIKLKERMNQYLLQ